MTQKTIRVAIAEDHQLLRESVGRLLAMDKSMCVVGLAANGNELIDLLKTCEADIVLLDMQMPVMSGHEILPVLTKNFPGTGVIVVSSFDGSIMVREIILKGAKAYLSKNVEIDKLIQTIKSVHNDGYCFDRDTARLVFTDIEKLNGADFKEIHPVLSEREIEIVKIYCQGKSQEEIANALYISVRTVKWHFQNIYRKTAADSTPSLIKYAIQNCITDMR